VPSSAGELAPVRGGHGGPARRRHRRRHAFELVLAEAESGEALEGLGEALYLEREYAAAAVRYERAYSLHRRQRRTMAAGRAARTLAWITGNVLGDWAVRSGWLARARTILAEAGQDRPEHGWVLILRSFVEPDAWSRWPARPTWASRRWSDGSPSGTRPGRWSTWPPTAPRCDTTVMPAPTWTERSPSSGSTT
jgi:hypothetical protein